MFTKIQIVYFQWRMIRPTRRKTQGQHLKAWVVETILARTEPTKAQSVKVLKAGLQ
jgi:hypothetical protein